MSTMLMSVIGSYAASERGASDGMRLIKETRHLFKMLQENFRNID
jgi:hypothetical protein